MVLPRCSLLHCLLITVFSDTEDEYLQCRALKTAFLKETIKLLKPLINPVLWSLIPFIPWNAHMIIQREYTLRRVWINCTGGSPLPAIILDKRTNGNTGSNYSYRCSLVLLTQRQTNQIVLPRDISLFIDALGDFCWAIIFPVPIAHALSSLTRKYYDILKCQTLSIKVQLSVVCICPD